MQAVFTSKGDWGVRASEESPAESYDGRNREDTHVCHEPIIDHRSGQTLIHLPDLLPSKRMNICYRNYKGDKIQGPK